MRITERQEKMLAIIREEKYITVTDLAKRSFTSPSSVRRDLTELQNNGLVRRTHGGVTLPEEVSGVASFSNRKVKNTREKRLIARKAASLLHDGQTILMDGSSSVTFLLPYIAKYPNSKLYTINLSTAMDAIAKGIDTHCLGGHSIHGSMVMIGPDTCRGLEGLNADICFFSAKSLDAAGFISDPNWEEVYICQLMIQRSRQSVFICDSSKFRTESPYRLASLSQISACVFDEPWNELQCRSQIML